MKALLLSLAVVAVGLGALTASAHGSRGKILIMVSSENELPLKNGKTYPTGYYLNELGVPAKALADAGYTLVFADPKGNTPSMDATSDNLKYFSSAQEREAIKTFVSSLGGLQAPLSLAQVIEGGLAQYVGLFIPGGHAPMIDLMASPELGAILNYFHAAGKPTALICHGPISLLAAIPDAQAYQQAMIDGDGNAAANIANGWIYAGYKMTIFSTAEEKQAEGKLGGPTLFYPDDALRTAGGDVSVALPWQSNVVVDRELITGQNPFSDQALAQALLKALQEN